jgi:hypothetical protein
LRWLWVNVVSTIFGGFRKFFGEKIGVYHNIQW